VSDIFRHPELVLLLIIGLAALAALWAVVLRFLAWATVVVFVVLVFGVGLVQVLMAIAR
jgi:hypothetical protein